MQSSSDANPLGSILQVSTSYEGIPAESWHAVNIGERWIAAFRMLDIDGHPEIGELRLLPGQRRNLGTGKRAVSLPLRTIVRRMPKRGLTADVLDAISLDELRKIARRDLRMTDDLFPTFPNGESLVAGPWGFSNLHEKPPVRTGRHRDPGHQELVLKVAELYDEKVRAGDRAPRDSVANDLGYSPSRISTLLHEARRRGLLTAAPGRGIAGGELTPQARQAIAATEATGHASR